MTGPTSGLAASLPPASMTTSTSPKIASVHWVPHQPNHVVLCSSDLQLFQLRRGLDPAVHFLGPRDHRLSEREALFIEKQIPEPPNYIKCVALHPSVGRENDETATGDIRLAVGQANGRISLLSFMEMSNSESGEVEMKHHVVKEFATRSVRACNAVRWHPTHGSLLAGGYEKQRGGHGLVVFDAEREPGAASAVVPPMATSASGGSQPIGSAFASLSDRFRKASVVVEEKVEPYVRPLLELGANEMCHSLDWTTSYGPFTIVAGMNNKQVRIYDTRSGATVMNTWTRSVYGVCTDPFVCERVASFHDNHVVIWDTRNFDKPIVTLSQSSRVVHMEWSPTRAGLLCSAEEAKPCLTLHDIQSWAVLIEDGEPAVTERTIQGWNEVESETEEYYSSFAWHPQNESLILGVVNGERLSKIHVTERISPSWSANHCLVWPFGGKLRSFTYNSSLFTAINDISTDMQIRAMGDYGKCERLADNLAFVSDYPALVSAWNWLDHCAKLMQDPGFKHKLSKEITFPGVRTVLGVERDPANLLRSDINYLPWNGGQQNLKPRKVYKSDAREQAQRICGWSMELVDLNPFIKGCEERNEISRAVAIAVFSLELNLASRILENATAGEDGASSNAASIYSIVKISLAGFNEDKNGAWRETVRTSFSQLDDPYLRAIFAFLSAENDHYGPIVEDTSLEVADRVAFSCMYLSDEKLFSTLGAYWNATLDQSDLNGLLLCGMNRDTLDLLQRYLDCTGDLQSVCWLSVRGMPSHIGLLDEVQNWFQCYRELLNAWKMWSCRAHFDISIQQAQMRSKPPQQVFVSCNFCGKSVAQHLKGMPTREEVRSASLSRQATSKRHLRAQACPACRKPLQKCAVCLQTMGSHSGKLVAGLPPKDETPVMVDFGDFFCWCQNCRHGGHVQHLTEWFEKHSECPVSGCVCKCSALDPNSFQVPAEPGLNGSGTQVTQ